MDTEAIVNFKTTLHLFIAVILLSLFIGILHIMPRMKDKALVTNDRIFPSGLEDADYILINSTNIHFECKQTNSEWRFIRPLTARADSGKIQQLLGSLESTKYIDTITLSQRANRELELNDFGFNNISPKLVVRSGTNYCSLLLGSKAPGDLSYVKFANKDDIMIVESSILDIFPENIDEWRARTVISGTAARTYKVMIQKGGSFIELLRNDKNDWEIKQPVKFSADNTIVDELLNALYTAEVNDFVWNKLVPWDNSTTDLSELSGNDIISRDNTYHLTPDLATVVIKVWLAGNNTGTELMLGKFSDESEKYIYAKLSNNNTIFTCDASLASKFNIDINGLRNKSLIHLPYKKINQLYFQYQDSKLTLHKDRKNGWLILEPVEWKADDEVTDSIIQMFLSLKIDKFIETSSENVSTNKEVIAEICLSMISDNELYATNNIDKTIEEENNNTFKQSIIITKIPNGDNENIFASYKDDNNILLKLDSITKTSFYKNLTEPLFFRDRNMLSLDKNSIIRIELNRNGKTQTVHKTKDGIWLSDDTDSNTVNVDAIENLLLIAANMRAIRIESDNIKKIEAYGLDQVTISVTFGLKGTEGIKKTIQLGFRAGTDGIYARIQGEDTVFVISTELASNLSRDIY